MVSWWWILPLALGALAAATASAGARRLRREADELRDATEALRRT
jgi:hypothetical protein